MNKLHMNPIWKKELRLGARTLRFPLSTMIISMIFSFVSLIILSISLFGNQYYYGSYFFSIKEYSNLTGGFQGLAFFQLFLVSVVVPILTAGSIAGEREKQTLDIMLTTPMSTFSIVMGKLMAALSNVFLFVMCCLPSMSVCFLYGGIQWSYLFIFLVGIMVIAFLTGAIGVWCSALFKRTNVAVIMTLFFEVAIYVAPIIITITFYLIRMMPYMVEDGLQIPTGGVSFGWTPLLLLLSPALGYINAIVSVCTGTEMMEAYIKSDLFSDARFPKGFETVVGMWEILSLIVVIAMGFLFVWLAARQLDSVRLSGKRLSRRKHS